MLGKPFAIKLFILVHKGRGLIQAAEVGDLDKVTQLLRSQVRKYLLFIVFKSFSSSLICCGSSSVNSIGIVCVKFLGVFSLGFGCIFVAFNRCLVCAKIFLLVNLAFF